MWFLGVLSLQSEEGAGSVFGIFYPVFGEYPLDGLHAAELWIQSPQLEASKESWQLLPNVVLGCA